VKGKTNYHRWMRRGMGENNLMLDHVNFSVNNLEESIEWYSRVFSYKVVERGTQDGQLWGIMRSGEALLCMYENPELKLLDRFDSAKLGVHYVSHVGVRISDRGAWESVIERENLEIQYDGVMRMPHSHAWYVIDPTGWEIEVTLWDDGPCFDHAKHTI